MGKQLILSLDQSKQNNMIFEPRLLINLLLFNCFLNFIFQMFVRAQDEQEVHLPIAPQIEQVPT